MCDRIGKVRADGSVLFITLNYNVDFDMNKSTLLRFYTREKRLDALLALGNLILLQASPYGKYETEKSPREQINCKAEIRDDFESKRKHQAKVAEDIDEFACVYGPAYLWKDGVWYYVSSSECTLLAEKSVPKAKPEPNYDKMSLRRLTSDGKVEKTYGEKFTGFDDVQRKANADQNIYFIFKDQRLIKTIHPQIQTA